MKNRVIVDIDGTISKVGDRIKYLEQKPKDWDSFYANCNEDNPISNVIELIVDLYTIGREIVFCSGRRESCRKDTEEWIGKHLYMEPINYSLLLRENDDYRHDTETKPELLQASNISLDTILFVLEDRTSMVKKWRELGLVCLQVADGDF